MFVSDGHVMLDILLTLSKYEDRPTASIAHLRVIAAARVGNPFYAFFHGFLLPRLVFPRSPSRKAGVPKRKVKIRLVEKKTILHLDGVAVPVSHRLPRCSVRQPSPRAHWQE
jgi:hypothetical protein